MEIPVNFKQYVAEVVDISTSVASSSVPAETEDVRTDWHIFDKIDRLGKTLIYWVTNETPGKLKAPTATTGYSASFKDNPAPGDESSPPHPLSPQATHDPGTEKKPPGRPGPSSPRTGDPAPHVGSAVGASGKPDGVNFGGDGQAVMSPYGPGERQPRRDREDISGTANQGAFGGEVIGKPHWEPVGGQSTEGTSWEKLTKKEQSSVKLSPMRGTQTADDEVINLQLLACQLFQVNTYFFDGSFEDLMKEGDNEQQQSTEDDFDKRFPDAAVFDKFTDGYIPNFGEFLEEERGQSRVGKQGGDRKRGTRPQKDRPAGQPHRRIPGNLVQAPHMQDKERHEFTKTEPQQKDVDDPLSLPPLPAPDPDVEEIPGTPGRERSQVQPIVLIVQNDTFDKNMLGPKMSGVGSSKDQRRPSLSPEERYLCVCLNCHEAEEQSAKGNYPGKPARTEIDSDALEYGRDLPAPGTQHTSAKGLPAGWKVRDYKPGTKYSRKAEYQDRQLDPTQYSSYKPEGTVLSEGRHPDPEKDMGAFSDVIKTRVPRAKDPSGVELGSDEDEYAEFRPEKDPDTKLKFDPGQKQEYTDKEGVKKDRTLSFVFPVKGVMLIPNDDYWPCANWHQKPKGQKPKNFTPTIEEPAQGVPGQGGAPVAPNMPQISNVVGGAREYGKFQQANQPAPNDYTGSLQSHIDQIRLSYPDLPEDEVMRMAQQKMGVPTESFKDFCKLCEDGPIPTSSGGGRGAPPGYSVPAPSFIGDMDDFDYAKYPQLSRYQAAVRQFPQDVEQHGQDMEAFDKEQRDKYDQEVEKQRAGYEGEVEKWEGTGAGGPEIPRVTALALEATELGLAHAAFMYIIDKKLHENKGTKHEVLNVPKGRNYTNSVDVKPAGGGPVVVKFASQGGDAPESPDVSAVEPVAAESIRVNEMARGPAGAPQGNYESTVNNWWRSIRHEALQEIYNQLVQFGHDSRVQPGGVWAMPQPEDDGFQPGRDPGYMPGSQVKITDDVLMQLVMHEWKEYKYGELKTKEMVRMGDPDDLDREPEETEAYY